MTATNGGGAGLDQVRHPLLCLVLLNINTPITDAFEFADRRSPIPSSPMCSGLLEGDPTSKNPGGDPVEWDMPVENASFPTHWSTRFAGDAVLQGHGTNVRACSENRTWQCLVFEKVDSSIFLAILSVFNNVSRPRTA
jgi:hypothetical protein